VRKRQFWATAPFTEERRVEMAIAAERGLELCEGKPIECAALAILDTEPKTTEEEKVKE
jgi:hypothetical protein